MTHDYKGNGPTLLTALNTLTGAVFARNMQRHRHQECIRFLVLMASPSLKHVRVCSYL